MDPFATFGIAPRFDLDRTEVEQRYRDLQRALHPDKFVNATAAERRLSLGKAVEVNEAYRVLRDDVARAQALLAAHGTLADEKSGASDPNFLMEVMDLREALGEAKAARDLSAVRALSARVTAMREHTLAALTTALEGLRPDATTPHALLDKAAALVARLRYFRRFLDEVSVIEDEATAPEPG